MDQLTDWLSLTVRWLHVIFGVAWIGTSFYFNWLNNSFRPVEAGPVDAGVEGEVWSVHGGKFYRVLKYGVAPAQLPKVLHWFKWEAYLTWISGFTLLALVYYVDSKVFLIDKQVRILEPWHAIGIGIGTLIVSWFVYDLLCKSPLKRKPVAFVIIAFALATAMAYGLTQVFGSRGAYIHVGAALGTMMAANVFRVII
ncbi:MAG: urate hydroxylase PuuD, partial [Myxococcales bacterium]|nr:urate hydroxylase PuuD [Myxococcales bacterium]